MPFAKLTELYVEDGVDHIRIFHRGATKLGSLLSINSDTPFKVEGAGKFGSARCFVHWLATGDEQARYSKTYVVKDHILYYPEILLYAKYLQLKDNLPLLKKEFRDDLKFMMYKVHPTGIRETYDWVKYTERVVQVARNLIAESEGKKVKYRWNFEIDSIIKKRIIEIGEFYAKAAKSTQPEETKPEEESTETKSDCKLEVEITTTEETKDV